MKRFSALYEALDQTTSTRDKVTAMRDYFAVAPSADAAWATYFLAGGKPRRIVPTAVLRATAVREAGLDDALFEDCYQAVGDLAETMALVLPLTERSTPTATPMGLAAWVEQRLLPMRGLDPQTLGERVAGYWSELDPRGRFLLNKLLGGGFRVGVSKLLVQRALAEHAQVDTKVMAERLMGYTDAKHMPTAARFDALRQSTETETDGETGENGRAPRGAQPYPFFLAHAWDEPIASMADALGAPSEWLIEWKYDGIRAQAVKRGGVVHLWSRGEELITEGFPDVVRALAGLPDGTVLDGELLVWLQGAPASFAMLQKRIMRKAIGAKMLAELPVVFMAYDLLEEGGQDLREQALRRRRVALEALHAGAVNEPASSELNAVRPAREAQAWRVSPRVVGADWMALDHLRNTARERGVEGFMVKALDSAYGVGRTKRDGVWWKWKVAPMHVDAVLIYAQRGHGRRAGVYTDYTFAVWNREPQDAAEAQRVVDAITRREPAQPGALQLVAFAKAYSGLTDAEFAEVNRVIRRTGLESFGPVKGLKPTLVFEIGFEGIGASPRHKSGVAVRFPRMLRMRLDKPLHEADTLTTLKALAQRPIVPPP